MVPLVMVGGRIFVLIIQLMISMDKPAAGRIDVVECLIMCLNFINPMIPIVIILVRTVFTIIPRYYDFSVQDHSTMGFVRVFYSIYLKVCDLLRVMIGDTYAEVEHLNIPVKNLHVRTSFPMMTEDEIRSVKSKYLFFSQMSMVVVVFITACLIGVAMGGLAFMILMVAGVSIVIEKRTRNFPNDQKIESNGGSLPLSQGIYRIKVPGPLLSSNAGIAFMWQGVLHTRFHVTGNITLSVGGILFKPTYMSESLDTICWGGLPRFRAPVNGEFVYPLIVNQSGACGVYETVYNHVGDSLGFMMSGITQPGSSGSPIFAYKRRKMQEDNNEIIDLDDEMDFVGLVGRNMRDPSGELWQGQENFQIEVVSPVSLSDATSRDFRDPHTQVFAHPGAGKTRRYSIQAVYNALHDGYSVVFTGPTRNVCNEILKALEHSFDSETISNYTRGGRRNLTSSRIAVIPHAFFLSKLIAGKWNLRGKTCIIMDETHMQDSSTIALLCILRNFASEPERPMRFIEMTATGYDLSVKATRNESISLYEIQDFAVSNIPEAIISFVSNNPKSKSVVFCQSVEGNSDSIRTMRGLLKTGLQRVGATANIIAFHRKNQADVYHLATTPISALKTSQIVLTTNLSEVGINLDADAVFDFRKQVMFKYEGRHIIHTIGPITEAQAIQRRGRVGRRREGKYFYPATAMAPTHDPDIADATIVDAAIICEAFDKRDMDIRMLGVMDIVNEFGLSYSKAQIMKFICGDVNTLFGAYIVYDANGVMRSNETQATFVKNHLVNDRKEWIYYDARERQRLGRIFDRLGYSRGVVEDSIVNEAEFIEQITIGRQENVNTFTCTYRPVMPGEVVHEDSTRNIGVDHKHVCANCYHVYFVGVSECILLPFAECPCCIE